MPRPSEAWIHKWCALAGEVGNEDRIICGDPLAERSVGFLKRASQERQRGFESKSSILNRTDSVPARGGVSAGGESVSGKRGVECGLFHHGHHLGTASHSNKTLAGLQTKSRDCAGSVSPTVDAGKCQPGNGDVPRSLMRGANVGKETLVDSRPCDGDVRPLARRNVTQQCARGVTGVCAHGPAQSYPQPVLRLEYVSGPRHNLWFMAREPCQGCGGKTCHRSRAECG